MQKNLHCSYWKSAKYLPQISHSYLQPIWKGVLKMKIHIWWQTSSFYFIFEPYGMALTNKKSKLLMIWSNFIFWTTICTCTYITLIAEGKRS